MTSGEMIALVTELRAAKLYSDGLAVDENDEPIPTMEMTGGYRDKLCDALDAAIAALSAPPPTCAGCKHWSTMESLWRTCAIGNGEGGHSGRTTATFGCTDYSASDLYRKVDAAYPATPTGTPRGETT